MSAPVLLITGASSGIGAATARAARDAGYALVLASRSALPAELTGDRVPPAELTGDRALAVRCDVRDPAQLDAAVAAALERFGRLDAVFANAGVGAARGFRNDTVDRWRAVVETNILGTALTIRASIDALK